MGRVCWGCRVDQVSSVPAMEYDGSLGDEEQNGTHREGMEKQ